MKQQIYSLNFFLYFIFIPDPLIHPYNYESNGILGYFRYDLIGHTFL